MHCDAWCWACRRRRGVLRVDRVCDGVAVRLDLCRPCWRREVNARARVERAGLAVVVEAVTRVRSGWAVLISEWTLLA